MINFMKMAQDDSSSD
jgi:hypothetical protein